MLTTHYLNSDTTDKMNATDSALNILLQSNRVEVEINNFLLIAIAVTAIVFLIIKYCRKQSISELEIDSAEFGTKLGKIKLKPNYDDKQVAYKLWVELSTRKIGIPIDFQNDVISEVYDSWYSFFLITRETIKEIPIAKLQNNKDTEKIVNLSIEVLNETIRPHLTLWQARFRRWYTAEIEKNDESTQSPQSIQKHFPKYTDLCEDLKKVNTKLISYRKAMRKIALGE